MLLLIAAVDSAAASVLTPAAKIQTAKIPMLSASPQLAGLKLGGNGRSKLVWDVLRRGGNPFDNDSGLGLKARALLESSFTPPEHTPLHCTVSSLRHAEALDCAAQR